MSELASHFKMDLSRGVPNKSCVFRGAKYRITIISDVLVRFEYDENGVFCDYPSALAINRNFETPKFNFNQNQEYLYIENSYFKIEYKKESSFIGTKVVPEANLRVNLRGTNKLWFYNNPEVRNLKGSVYSLDNTKEKHIFNKGLFSTDGFALIDDSKSLIFLENGSPARRRGTGLDLYLFVYNKDFNKALDSYYKLTGYPFLIPRYALGVWWNKHETYNASSIIELNSKFKKNEIPYSVLLLYNWHVKKYKMDFDIKSGFTFNKEIISNEIEFANFMHNNKVKIGLEINPVFGFYPFEETFKTLAQLMNTNETTRIPFNVYNIDIINYLLNYAIDNLKNKGMDFFMITTNDKKDLNTLYLLNYYIFNDYKKNKMRGITISRNHNFAPHRNTILYSGETKVDWKTLETLPALNSCGANIGISWWTHDIGGFSSGIEDSELYTRYVQLGTFSPIFRFSSLPGRYYKREPWNWDVKILSIVKEYTQLRHKLIPYIYSMAYSYHKFGVPLSQPLYYMNPEIIDETRYKNEYLFGSELLVSPITTQKDLVMNRVIHRIFFPEGTWFEFKTGKKFIGNKRYITFYRDEDYPVFAHAGAIVPLSVIDKNDLNDTSNPKILEVHVFPGRSNGFNLYEDDGITNNYENGEYLITNFDYNYQKNNYTLIIRPVAGNVSVVHSTRTYKIRFRNTKYSLNTKVYIDDKNIEHIKYIDGKDFVIELKDITTAKQITINCQGDNIEIDETRIVNEDIDSIISDLKITTDLKILLANIMFSTFDIKKKRVEIKKLKKKGLDDIFVRMFMKLLDYIGDL